MTSAKMSAARKGPGFKRTDPRAAGKVGGPIGGRSTARKLNTCKLCARQIYGNAFYSHAKVCKQIKGGRSE